MTNLSKRITNTRKQARIKQAEIADKVDVSVQTVSRWERGERCPDAEELLKLAAALSTSVAYLVGETNDPTPCLAGTAANVTISGSNSAVSDNEREGHNGRETSNQNNKEDSAVSEKIDLDAIVAKGYIVIERDNKSDNKSDNKTRIFLPPTRDSYDLARELATDTESSSKPGIEIHDPSHIQPSRKIGKAARRQGGAKILCLYPDCGGELRRVQREDGAVIWECLNRGRTYEEKAA